jgi:hypothetical protein
MSTPSTVDSKLKSAVGSLKKDWVNVVSAYESFAEKKLKFAKKINVIWLQAKELDGDTDGVNINFLREQCQELIQTSNKTILSKWITIGENADKLLPYSKSLPSQRDSLYAISGEIKRLKGKTTVIDKWIKTGQISQDSTVRDVDALRTTVKKKKFSDTDTRYVKVTLTINSNYEESFELLKSIIQSDKVKRVQAEKAFRAVANEVLDEKSFNQIAKKFD